MKSSLVLLFILLALPGTVAAGEPQPCDLSYPSDSQVPFTCRYFENGSWLEPQFGELWIDLLHFNRLDRRHADRGVCLRLPQQLSSLRSFSPLPLQWPEAAAAEKFILVDLSEQFLGAYSHGQLLFSLPIATGDKLNETPSGRFTIDAFHRQHRSSLYTLEKSTLPYPMPFALRFYINPSDVSYWIHGRDLPGYPASHGCIGLSDEEMQRHYYGYPPAPLLADAQLLYDWVTEGTVDNGSVTLLPNGPTLLIIGKTPVPKRR
jgi:hypothetical protein